MAASATKPQPVSRHPPPDEAVGSARWFEATASRSSNLCPQYRHTRAAALTDSAQSGQVFVSSAVTQRSTLWLAAFLGQRDARDTRTGQGHPCWRTRKRRLEAYLSPRRGTGRLAREAEAIPAGATEGSGAIGS